MIVEDELNKMLLDKIIQNVISCLPIIEKIVNEQNKRIKETTGVINERDFVIGGLWCTILEKFLVAHYLYTGKTITLEQGIEISQYTLDRISKLSV